MKWDLKWLSPCIKVMLWCTSFFSSVWANPHLCFTVSSCLTNIKRIHVLNMKVKYLDVSLRRFTKSTRKYLHQNWIRLLSVIFSCSTFHIMSFLSGLKVKKIWRWLISKKDFEAALAPTSRHRLLVYYRSPLVFLKSFLQSFFSFVALLLSETILYSSAA